jgi:hypothetical protein
VKKKKSAKAKTKSKKAKPARKAVKARVKAKAKPKAKKAFRKSTKAKKRPVQARKGTVIPPVNGVLLGRVEDYFAKIGVMAFTLQRGLRIGDRLHILGHTTHIEQTADSMQIDHLAVTEAQPKAAVGIKVNARVRRGDHVYLISG